MRLDGEHLARGLRNPSGRELGQGSFHGWDQVFHPKHGPDLIFCEEWQHRGPLFFTERQWGRSAAPTAPAFL